MRQQSALGLAAAVVICLAAVGFVAGLITDANAGDKKYKLEYKMKKGSGFEMATTTERKSQREMMGNEIKSTTTDMAKYVVNVIEEKGGMATASLTYKDRSHKSDDPQVQLDPDFSALLGQKARFVISERGILSGFDGFAELPELDIAGGQARRGESQYINELREFFIQLPEEKIGIGDTWSYTDEFTEPVEGGTAKIVIAYTYTLAEAAEREGFDCVRFDGEYTTTVTGTGTAQGMEYTLKLDGTGTETVWFAHKRGMLVESESISFVEGGVTAEMVGFEMPMRNDYKSTRTYTLE
ncbi:MAG: hypothetical protein JSW50_09920 [Candidatus Latescibacterota bacterium]|nr:MAG: hypothetical protein JSW50_09920 [Candidatus Latescibacterota bacterium]